jgi:acyl-CoA thioesterase YciA
MKDPHDHPLTGSTVEGATLVIRTLAMPCDTNYNGDIFGGWLVSQMDMGAGIFATRYSTQRVATVAIEQIQFLAPVRVGDTVSCHAKMLKIGNTSMRIAVEVWVLRKFDREEKKVALGTFIFVAIDAEGRPIPVR